MLRLFCCARRENDLPPLGRFGSFPEPEIVDVNNWLQYASGLPFFFVIRIGHALERCNVPPSFGQSGAVVGILFLSLSSLLNDQLFIVGHLLILVFIFLILLLVLLLRRGLPAGLDSDLLADAHLPRAGVALEDEAPLGKDAALVLPAPGLAEAPHHDLLPPADVDGDGPPGDAPGLVAHEEVQRAHGGVAVAVGARVHDLEGVQDRLHVQGERVQGREGAHGPQELRRVRVHNVHVQLEHLDLAHPLRQKGQVLVVDGRAAAVLLAEARVVAEAQRRQRAGVGEQRVHGEVVRVHGDLQRREGADVRPDEQVEPPRRLDAQVREVRAEVLAVQDLQVDQLVEADRVEEVEHGHRDQLQGRDAREVPVPRHLVGAVPPVVGAEGELAQGREAFVGREVELRALATVLEVEGLEPPRGEEEVLERVQPGDERRCWVSHFQRDQEVDGYRSKVGVAHLALKVPERKFLHVQLGAIVTGLLCI